MPFDQVDFSELFRGDNGACGNSFGVDPVRLVGHDLPSETARFAEHDYGFLIAHGHGFVAEHVAAAAESEKRLLLVKNSRRGDDGQIGADRFKHGFRVREYCRRMEGPDGFIQPFFIGIHDGDKLKTIFCANLRQVEMPCNPSCSEHRAAKNFHHFHSR